LTAQDDASEKIASAFIENRPLGIHPSLAGSSTSLPGGSGYTSRVDSPVPGDSTPTADRVGWAVFRRVLRFELTRRTPDGPSKSLSKNSRRLGRCTTSGRSGRNGGLAARSRGGMIRVCAVCMLRHVLQCQWPVPDQALFRTDDMLACIGDWGYDESQWYLNGIRYGAGERQCRRRCRKTINCRLAEVFHLLRIVTVISLGCSGMHACDTPPLHRQSPEAPWALYTCLYPPCHPVGP
jgi:hypothetical protein